MSLFGSGGPRRGRRCPRCKPCSEPRTARFDAWPDNAQGGPGMIKTKANVEIRRPVSEVFAFVTRVDNFPRWFGDNVATSRQTSPGAVGVGTTFAQTHHFLGQRFESRFVVTAYEPDRLFCVGTSAGPVPFQ